MIRFSPVSTTPAELVGRYVLFEEGFAFPSFGRALQVVSVSASKLVGVEPPRYFLQGEGPSDGWYALQTSGDALPEDTLRQTGGNQVTRQLVSVRCVCDTPEEVNEVLRMGRSTAAAYKAFVQDSYARFRELEGPAAPAVDTPRRARRPR